jgi:hypothetical protein
MFIFTFQLIPPKVIHTIVSGSGLPLTKVCLEGKTNQRRIYKKIRETLVKNGLINPNTVLKWMIHGEEIMINHFIDLSELLQTVNKCNEAIGGCVRYNTIQDITRIVFNDAKYISSELEHVYSLEELYILDTITNEQFVGFSSLHSLIELSFKSFTNILTIPPEYKKLKNLNILSINRYGSPDPEALIAAPHELGILHNLKRLNLADNNIDSSIESLESITQLKYLEYLNLSYNNLTVLPDIFNRLICLKELDISNTNISDYPPVINRIHSLESLSISFSLLTTFPDIQLPNLYKLHLTSNHIDNINSKNINIPKLEELHLNDNRLSSIPEFIYSLQNLRELNLIDNRIDPADLDAYKSKYPNVNTD